jgi:hypothetical protein
MTEAVTFKCSICGESSTEICRYCTKDACANHLCERCGRCSDCCDCDARNAKNWNGSGTHAKAENGKVNGNFSRTLT